MFFLGLVILGVIGWIRLPVELMPQLGGNELNIQLLRPGSDPELVERELMMPLEARLSSVEGLAESWGKIQGSSGNLRLRFERGTDLGIRQLELQQIAAELQRTQPRGTMVEVYSQDFSAMSRFVMVVQIAGGSDPSSLRDVVDERIVPRLASVAGVSRVMVSGGASREITVQLDPKRCAEAGVMPSQVVSALSSAVGTQRFLGAVPEGRRRDAVILDGRPQGLISLGETRILRDRPVLLRHVAELSMGPGREETAFRVNGKPAVGLVVFQEEGANLVALGRRLRQRIESIRRESEAIGLDAVIGFDASKMVQEQLNRLKKLGLSGFVVALIILFLFLRRFESLLVVAVAVPVSLLTAVALLNISGLSLNLITLFGLAVGIGMLVDNSIVVYESIERLMSRGLEAGEAVRQGAGRSIRAILAASLTNAVVFLPVVFSTEDSLTRGILRLLALAIVLPLAASVIVALGLVPLLAHRMGVPAARARISREKRRRENSAGLPRKDRWRELFSGLLVSGLRRPAGWMGTVGALILVTALIAVPWVAVSTAGQEAPEADELRMQLETPASASLDATGEIFARLEHRAMDQEGVASVESVFNEESGTLTVKLKDKEKRPPGMDVTSLRRRLTTAVKGIKGLEMRRVAGSGEQGGGAMQALFGGGAEEIRISGPDGEQLQKLAESIRRRLESLPEIPSAWTRNRAGMEEIQVRGRSASLDSLALTPDQILPALASLRREGMQLRLGYGLGGGREIPVVVRSPRKKVLNAMHEIADLQIATTAGVRSMDELASIRMMPPPAPIEHHNGHRETSVYYSLAADAPRTGPARQDLEARIAAELREMHRPAGTTIERAHDQDSTSWFARILLPVLLLLFAVLAITFESLSMPFLVLSALPLTVLGATWALVFSGTPAGLMAMVGVVALLGLTVNPAILLVDRMQEKVRHGWGAGAAAVAAVRERSRPVLMTSCTTIAGLWPLALSSGREMEIWPPFATVIMGGLLSSTLLTLLVIPMGFVLVAKLDRLFGRLGPWIIMAWIALSGGLMSSLIVGGLISTLRWQIITGLLVAALFLGLAVLIFRRPERPVLEGTPPKLDLRFLRKVYGAPGPVGKAMASGKDFARRVAKAGGDPVDRPEALQKAVGAAIIAGGILALAFAFSGLWWKMVFSLTAAAILGGGLREFRRSRGLFDRRDGRVLPGGIENVLAFSAPYFVLAVIGSKFTILPWLAGKTPLMPPFALVFWLIIISGVQAGRRSAERASAGLPVRGGGLGAVGRKLSRRLFGLDLPREEVEALSTISFSVEEGMVGILGPNGAGKTTLLRILAGVLEPDLGRITLGGVPLKRLRKYLARWVGYLPQEFGLPEDLSAREYLEYFALLYGVGTGVEAANRVENLLTEVGLKEGADEKIGSYSGGMKQRVAVARTLLRLPPIIIVDEPTVGLDPRERIRFRNLLGRLAKGRIVLFSTHVVEDVAVICRRVLVLRKGELVFDGRVDDLSSLAEGRVWKLRIHESAEEEVGGRIVDRVPEGDGMARLRILSEGRPHREAELLPATLEDGYLLLTREEA